MNPYLDPGNNPYLRPAATNPYYDPNPVNPYIQQETAPTLPDVALVRSNAEAGFNEVEKAFQSAIESLGLSVDRLKEAVQGVLDSDLAAQANQAEARQAEQALVANERLRPRIARYRDVQSFAGYVDWGLSVSAEQVPLALSMLASGALRSLGGAMRIGRVPANQALGKAAARPGTLRPFRPDPRHGHEGQPCHG